MKESNWSVLLGAAFLMATSAIGPGFLTQTTVFTGKLDKAIAARMMLDGKRTGVFFVEPDAEVVLDVKTNEAKGGALNAANAGFAAKERELVAAFVPLPTRQPKRPYTKNTCPSATA